MKCRDEPVIAAHLRKEQALTRCRYSVENCPPPPARDGLWRVATSKPRVRRVNRSVRPWRGRSPRPAQDKLRRTWAALAPAGPPPRLAQAAPAAVAVVLAPAVGAPRPSDRGAWTVARIGPPAARAGLGACASRWRRNSIDGAWRALGRCQGWGGSEQGGGRGSTPSRAPSTALPVFGAGDCTPRVREGLAARPPRTRPRRARPSPGSRQRGAFAKSATQAARARSAATRRAGGPVRASSGSASSSAPRWRLRRGGIVGGATRWSAARWSRRSPMASAAQDAGRKAARIVRRVGRTVAVALGPAVLWPWRRRGAQPGRAWRTTTNPPPRRLPRPMSAAVAATSSAAAGRTAGACPVPRPRNGQARGAQSDGGGARAGAGAAGIVPVAISARPARGGRPKGRGLRAPRVGPARRRV